MHRDERTTTFWPRRLPFAVALGLLLVTSACRDLPRQVGRNVRVIEEGRLTELNPGDVAVVPVVLEEGVHMPADRLRTFIARGLPGRAYSALSNEYVDSRVMEASYRPGTAGEDAVCQVTVYRWDETYWDTGQYIDYDIELRMIDPARPQDPSLWAGRLTDRVDVTEFNNTVIEAKLYDKALEMVAGELLAALPARQARPGRR
jgi:hypothetical protein